MIQPNLNPSGWGYDLCYSYFCPQYSRSLGVVDNQIAIHQKKFGRLRVDTTHLSASSLHQMHPGAQKQYWLDEISSIRNKTARCKDIERHSRGKPLQ